MISPNRIHFRLLQTSISSSLLSQGPRRCWSHWVGIHPDRSITGHTHHLDTLLMTWACCWTVGGSWRTWRGSVRNLHSHWSSSTLHLDHAPPSISQSWSGTGNPELCAGEGVGGGRGGQRCGQLKHATSLTSSPLC